MANRRLSMKQLFPVLILVLSLVCFASGTANITGGLSFGLKTPTYDADEKSMLRTAGFWSPSSRLLTENTFRNVKIESFDCTKNGSLLIFGTEAASYGSIYATQTKGTNNETKCTSSRHGNEENVTFEIKSCNISFPIKVILMHEKQNNTEEATVVGGKNSSFYNLTCNNIPVGGFSLQKKLNLTESETVTYEPYMEPTLNVTMEIRASGSSITNDPVLIGTALQLSISCEEVNVNLLVSSRLEINKLDKNYSLPGDMHALVGFTLFVEICIATDASQKHSKTLLISGSSMDMNLLSNFTDMNTPTVAHIASSTQPHPRHSKEATLYAFHFVGSNSIEIVCNITVCQSDDTSCPFSPVPTPVTHASTSRSSTNGSTPATASTIKSSPPNSARRKRNITPAGPRTEMLRTDLRVVDKSTDNINDMNTKASGNSNGPAIWVCLVVLAVSVARTLM